MDWWIDRLFPCQFRAIEAVERHNSRRPRQESTENRKTLSKENEQKLQIEQEEINRGDKWIRTMTVV